MKRIDGGIMKIGINEDEKWRTYTAICDRCGRHFAIKVPIKARELDMEEADFCNECLGYFILNRISYEDAKKQYRK